jgi:triacylglycerol lipase
MTHCNKTDTQVLVCRWNDDVVAAFRGTELKLRDWLSDLNGKLVPNQGGGGRVHSGFQTALNSVYPEIMHCIDAVAEPGKRRLFVCGHSLGGALALLFASRYQQESAGAGQSRPRLCEVFTYGAPRIGDVACADSYRKTSIAEHTYCWADREDPVTRVAPVSMNYRHAVQRQLYVDKDNWVRRRDIDITVPPEHDEPGIPQRFAGLTQTVNIAVSLQASSHKLETSCLQQLKDAARRQANS